MRLDEYATPKTRGHVAARLRTLFRKGPDQYQLEVRQSVAETERLKREAVETSQQSGSSFGEMGMSAMAADVRRGDGHQRAESRFAKRARKRGRPSSRRPRAAALLPSWPSTIPAKYKELTAQAESLRARGVVRSLEEANQFVFAMQSAGSWRRDRDVRPRQACRTDARTRRA